MPPHPTGSAPEDQGRPAASDPTRVAIVGAGMAGLACARALADHGVPVRVYEKARGPGGRTSTRRSDHGRFDHGAQYFTARDPGFARAVEAWLRDGHVAGWEGRIVSLRSGETRPAKSDAVRYVATPRMSSLARYLGRDLEIACGVRVTGVEWVDEAWRLSAADGASTGAADVVLVATPPAQAVPLLGAAPALAARAAGAELAPCHAVMAAFDEPLKPGFDAAFVEDSPVAWAARDASKPGRDPGERWVLHSTPAWSEAHLDDPTDEIAGALLDAFGRALGRPLPTPVHRVGHRWLYARATKPVEADALYDASLGIGACGDWCGGNRVESAWLSGIALASRVLGAGAGRETTASHRGTP